MNGHPNNKFINNQIQARHNVFLLTKKKKKKKKAKLTHRT